MDTVKLNGKGFEEKAESGTKVKIGDELVKYNLNYIAENARSTKTPIIVSNMDEVEEIQVVAQGDVKVGDLIMKVKLKKQ
jgi:PTS system glucose-specific IIA component